MNCPPDLHRRAEILFANAFGHPKPGDYFLVARLGNEISPEDLQQIRAESGAFSADNINMLGRDLLQIRWDEYDRISAALTATLRRGIPFTVNNRMSVRFTPADGTFSYHTAEHKFIAWMESLTPGTRRIIVEGNPRAYIHEWNYRTPEGKQWVVKIRRELNKADICQHPAITNHYTWPIFRECDLTTLQQTGDSQTQPFGSL